MNKVNLESGSQTTNGTPCELSLSLKKYRTERNMSQEDLAEKICVTRQTISNWENGKSYPDIHSLLLLSSLFHISLEQLIQEDIQTMKEEIDKNELGKFNRDSTIFGVLLVVSIVSFAPLTYFLSYYGLIISALIYAAGMYYAIKIEKQKKKYNIQTYKEIVAFTEGKTLSELEKAVETGKRPYQKFLLAFASALITLAVTLVLLHGLFPFLNKLFD